MSDQGRSNQGRFLSKSEENRQVRSMRLTDYVWQKLGEIASFKNLTRADLLEEFVRSGALDLNLGGKVMEHKLETDGLQNDDQECVVRLSRKTMYKVDKAAGLRSITRNELIENFINSGVFEQKTKFDSSTRMTVTKFAKFIGVAPKTVRDYKDGKRHQSLIEWSKSKTLDGKAWDYDPISKLYFQVDEI